jgi:carbonic anhydrase
MTHFDDLIQGYRRFRSDRWADQRDRWSQLAEGQNPRTMVIACSDSRVDPAQIFDTRPGEMFVVRNVGALVPPHEVDHGYHGVSAALEFAVTQLEVTDLLVMGHGACGGCAAALTGQFDGAATGAGHFIAHWVGMLDEARERVRRKFPEGGPEAFTAMEHEGVRVSLRNLLTFPWVRERVEDGRLTLRGGWFAIRHGELHLMDPATGEFAPA